MLCVLRCVLADAEWVALTPTTAMGTVCLGTAGRQGSLVFRLDL